MSGNGTPPASGDFDRDARAFGDYWRAAADRLARLPGRPARSASEAAEATTLLAATREARERFLDVHAGTVYRRLTGDLRRHVRVGPLAREAAALVPGLTPDAATLAAEAPLAQKDKDGHEIDQGILLAHVLARPDTGAHLAHAMLLPHPDTAAHTEEYRRDGRLDLGAVRVERQGAASVVTLANPRSLNAEDDTTLDATEIAVDLAIADPDTQVCVLRGGIVEHRKYAGRRTFGAGINLTRLYNGRIPYLWYIERDLGFVNKMYRGLARPDVSPDEAAGGTTEKVWIAGVDTFAIGGACQILLVCDWTVAGRDAYLTLPARKEGIIPGAANLRLPRFVGDRLARQAIMAERRIEADSDVGRMICDDVVPTDGVDAGVARAVERLTGSGVVSAASNRRALRLAAEPFDLFRRYMAVYCREQAWCHYSPALIGNLERFWDAQNRRL
ncbi:MAG: enoyl-CoA hydratase/isomerase family protein [Alphaproteobacteria bacterium]